MNECDCGWMELGPNRIQADTHKYVAQPMCQKKQHGDYKLEIWALEMQ